MDIDPVMDDGLARRRLVYHAGAMAAASFFSFTAETYGEMPAVTSTVLWWPGAMLTAVLLMTPRRTDTDGFYVSVLTRR